MDYSYCDYPSGEIEAIFGHASEYDFINLDIRMAGDKVIALECDEQDGRAELIRQEVKIEFQVRMSSVFCPFKDFIRFLEAVTIQVQECAFAWDGEGPDGRMHWSRHRVQDSGFLTVEWRASDNSSTHGMKVKTRQAVKELYSAFRTFVESGDYDPIRYETLSYGEGFGLVLSDASLDELAGRLVRMNATQAKIVLKALDDAFDSRSTKGPKLCFAIEHFLQVARPVSGLSQYDSWIDPQWDMWDSDQRMAHLKELYGWKHMDWFGANLREMRSTLIEDWLALPEAKPARNKRRSSS